MVPKKNYLASRGENEPTFFYMPKKLKNRIKQIAKVNGRSLAAELRLSLTKVYGDADDNTN